MILKYNLLIFEDEKNDYNKNFMFYSDLGWAELAWAWAWAWVWAPSIAWLASPSVASSDPGVPNSLVRFLSIG